MIKLMVAAKCCCFHIYRNKLFNGKPILQFGAATFVLIFVSLSSLAALFALFSAKRLCLDPKSFTIL